MQKVDISSRKVTLKTLMLLKTRLFFKKMTCWLGSYETEDSNAIMSKCKCCFLSEVHTWNWNKFLFNKKKKIDTQQVKLTMFSTCKNRKCLTQECQSLTFWVQLTILAI